MRYQVLAFACALAVVTYIHRIGFAVGAPAIGDEPGPRPGAGRLLDGGLSGGIRDLSGARRVAGRPAGRPPGADDPRARLVAADRRGRACRCCFPAERMLPFAFLLVLRFFFGMFQAGGFPTLGRVIADWMPLTERGSAQGSIWMFSRWGGALIPFLLVWLFRVWGGWPIPFLLIAGLGLLWCGAFWPWFRDHPEEMPQVNRGELKIIAAGRAKFSLAADRVPWEKCSARRASGRLCLMYGFTGFSGNFFTTMLPLYPDQAAASLRRRDRLAFGVAAGRRVDRLHPGRHRVGLGDPPLRQPQVGPPIRRVRGIGPGRSGVARRQLGRERLVARRCS